MKVFHGPRKILIRGTELYKQICDYIRNILENISDENINPLLFVMKCDVFKIDVFKQAWILNIIKNIKQNAFRLYGPNIIEDIHELGSVIQVTNFLKVSFSYPKAHLFFKTSQHNL